MRRAVKAYFNKLLMRLIQTLTYREIMFGNALAAAYHVSCDLTFLLPRLTYDFSYPS